MTDNREGNPNVSESAASIWRNPDAVTIPALLAAAAARWPERPFLDVAGDVVTFAAMEERANRLAHGLAAIGVARGDRVCSLLDTSIDAMVLWFGVVKLGAVIVPINTAYRGEYLRHQVADASSRIIVCESHYIDRVLAIQGQLESLTTLIHRGGAPAGASRLALLPLADVAIEDASAPDVAISPGDLATLIYTSGTTGPSKGCMLSHYMPCHCGIPTLRNQGITGDDVVWMALPFFHLAAISIVMGCLQLGAKAVVAPRFSVSGFWPDIERSGATAVFALATMFPLLVEAPETPEEKRCFGKIRCVFGAPFLADMQQRWKDRFGVEHTAAAGYGMTEVSPIATYPGHAVPAGATGRPIDCLDVRIFDDEGREAPPGVAGEIVLRPRVPHVMFDGYWRRPEATAEAFRDLWFHCGDIGKIDAEGYLYFVDRKKDYLRYRGENISSHELESTFRAHPAIADAAIHAVPSRFSEDDVKATIVLREGFAATEQEVCEWAIEQLPFFAVPRYVEFRAVLPRNAIGRVLKFELRAEGVTPATWDREAAGVRVPR